MSRSFKLKKGKDLKDFFKSATKTPNPTTKAVPSKPKPMTEEEISSDHDKGNLEDKMRDAGVFSIGGQKNN
tara:strand:- start:97 stop:309 length:213 start_codon:yes stop_codon:yes gene_type:complete